MKLCWMEETSEMLLVISAAFYIFLFYALDTLIYGVASTL